MGIHIFLPIRHPASRPTQKSVLFGMQQQDSYRSGGTRRPHPPSDPSSPGSPSTSSNHPSGRRQRPRRTDGYYHSSSSSRQMPPPPSVPSTPSYSSQPSPYTNWGSPAPQYSSYASTPGLTEDSSSPYSDNMNQFPQTPLYQPEQAASAATPSDYNLDAEITNILLNTDNDDGRDELHRRIIEGNYDGVSETVAELSRLGILGRSLYRTDNDGYTPLVRAASKGKSDIVSLLCEYLDNEEFKQNEVENAIHAAIANKHFKIPFLLISNPQDVFEFAAKSGYSPLNPLFKAAPDGVNPDHEKIIKAALENNKYKASTELYNLIDILTNVIQKDSGLADHIPGLLNAEGKAKLRHNKEVLDQLLFQHTNAAINFCGHQRVLNRLAYWGIYENMYPLYFQNLAAGSIDGTQVLKEAFNGENNEIKLDFAMKVVGYQNTLDYAAKKDKHNVLQSIVNAAYNERVQLNLNQAKEFASRNSRSRQILSAMIGR